ncbi:MAG: hypothetical protein NW224_17625 [Leptolyngbyaceae cyanobacterium bins.302]|nr:hypothetical protein [Leptolyngbyaceae cyanobacterium bins.302]
MIAYGSDRDGRRRYGVAIGKVLSLAQTPSRQSIQAFLMNYLPQDKGKPVA